MHISAMGNFSDLNNSQIVNSWIVCGIKQSSQCDYVKSLN